MDKADFIFHHKDTAGGHEDYWFKVVGSTGRELTHIYAKMYIQSADMVVYSKDEDTVYVCIFRLCENVFHYEYCGFVLTDDPVLKSILVELTAELEEA